jgi:hypothetical protein
MGLPAACNAAVITQRLAGQEALSVIKFSFFLNIGIVESVCRRNCAETNVGIADWGM